jgi:hypothetical protein
MRPNGTLFSTPLSYSGESQTNFVGLHGSICVKLFFDNSVKLYSFSILGYEENWGTGVLIPHSTLTAFLDSCRSSLFFLCRLEIGACASKS